MTTSKRAFPRLNLLRHAVQDLLIVSTGAVLFRLTDRTPTMAYQSMRRLYWLTRGRSNRLLSRLLERRAAQPQPVSGVLGTLGADALGQAAEHIRRDGYYVFPTKLSPEQCDELAAFARATAAELRPNPDGAPHARFDPEQPRAIGYYLPENELCAQPIVQSLVADESLLGLAERYLGCRPLNDMVAMWWTVAHGGQASSEVAQLYHFDMDHLKFLKIFFYLTDVTTETGPHCYVVGSHRERPARLWVDGRLGDDAISEAYGHERMRELTGPRGTIIAVDTSGFHKGKPLVTGHRLLLQLEYTNSFFGVEVARMQGRARLTEMAPSYADAFTRFVD
jgi:hypothetical protein